MQLSPELRSFARTAFVTASRIRRHAALWSWRVVPRSWRRPLEVVDSFDTWAYLSELTEAVSEFLERNGI